MQLDHVLVAVGDLGAAAVDLEDRYGLVSVAGGRHPGWGTANAVVPLGDAYLELIAVVDAAEAAAAAFGRWVQRASPGSLVGWAVRTDDLDSVAGRLGLAVQDGLRRTPEGSELRWRAAGVEAAAADPSLPFFIEWHSDTRHPGRAGESRATLARVVIRGDGARLGAWLGPHSLPITVHPGMPAVRSVVLECPGGEIVLGES